MLRKLLKLPIQQIYRYSTQQKKNVVVIPKDFEVKHQNFQDIWSCIVASPSCKALAALLKDNLPLFTDSHLKYLFNHLAEFQLEIDDHFHTIIAPITIEYVNAHTRQNAATLERILVAMLINEVQSPELENAVIKKLDEENIYRYVNLRETVTLFNEMSKFPRFANHSLMKKLQNVIYTQRKYYQNFPSMIEDIKQGMENIQKTGQKPLQIQEAYKELV